MSGASKISVLIPLYRGRKTIKPCLESLLVQDSVELEILMLDNGCPDGTGEWAGSFMARQPSVFPWRILDVPANIGFAAGNNLLYAQSTFPLVLTLNQDVELAPGHLKILADALERHPDWGGITGTLFRKSDNESKRIIDTTGHVIFRDRIVRNRGVGLILEKDAEIPWPEGEVFGISAACALFRREALESSREIEGPFDPDFFAYFEDVDLDYRMHRAGWKLGFVPDARGTHALAGSGGRRELDVRTRAYGNRRRILWKHESFSSLAPDLPLIFLQDLYGWLRALFTDPLVCIAGPWYLYIDIRRVLKRRKSYDIRWGSGRTWIREYLRPERERLTERA